MKLTVPLHIFLTNEKASVGLFNRLCGRFQPGTRVITLLQFIDQWPLARLKKEVFGFGPKAQAELLEILSRHIRKTGQRFDRYVISLRPGERWQRTPEELAGMTMQGLWRELKIAIEQLDHGRKSRRRDYLLTIAAALGKLPKSDMKKHDIIVLTRPCKGDERQPFPAGAVGVIVRRHKGGKQFEVEFPGNGEGTIAGDDLRLEHTCVYCGCTDSHACRSGCTWVELHQHTPTGVCSNCTASIVGLQRLDLGSFILIKPGCRGPGKVWLEYKPGHEGMDTDETKLAQVLQKFFDKEF